MVKNDCARFQKQPLPRHLYDEQSHSSQFILNEITHTTLNSPFSPDFRRQISNNQRQSILSHHLFFATTSSLSPSISPHHSINNGTQHHHLLFFHLHHLLDPKTLHPPPPPTRLTPRHRKRNQRTPIRAENSEMRAFASFLAAYELCVEFE